METQTTAVDRNNFPTLEVNAPITAQQIRGFLQQAGIELKFPKPDHGLNAQFRLELAASYLNTFLLVEDKKKAVRGSKAADTRQFRRVGESAPEN
jgi:hypothetical protein